MRKMAFLLFLIAFNPFTGNGQQLTFERAKEAFDSANYQLAANYFAQLCLEQKDDSACYYGGITYLLLENYDSAVVCLDAYIQQVPKNGDAYEFRSMAKYELGQQAAARKDLELAMQYNNREDYSRSLKYYGLMVLDVGYPDDAMAYFDKAIARDTTDIEAYYLKAKSLMLAEKNTEAYLLLEQQLEKHSEHCDFLYLMGLLKSKALEMYDPAVNDFYSALEYCDDSMAAEVLLELAGTFEQMELYESALTAYNELLNLNPDHLSGLYNAGTFKTDVGLYEEAIAHFEQLIDLSGADADIYFQLGFCNAALDQNKDAATWFTESIRLDSTDYNAWFNRAGVYSSLDEYKFAVRDYTYSLKLNPDELDAYYNRGLVYYEQGEFRKAEDDLSHYILNVPNDPVAYYLRGEARYNDDNPHGACADWKKTKELGRKDLWKQVEVRCEE